MKRALYLGPALITLLLSLSASVSYLLPSSLLSHLYVEFHLLLSLSDCSTKRMVVLSDHCIKPVMPVLRTPQYLTSLDNGDDNAVLVKSNAWHDKPSEMP